MSTKTIYGFDDLGNKVAIGSYEEAQKVTITLSSPSYAKSFLTGAGEYYVGDSCTITAPYNPLGGASFFNHWASDSNGLNVVSTSSEYTFIVTENATYYAIYTHSGGSSL